MRSTTGAVLLVVLGGCLAAGSLGCAGQLDKDLLAIRQTDQQTWTAFITLERAHITVMDEKMTQVYDAADKGIERKWADAELASMTGPDGKIDATPAEVLQAMHSLQTAKAEVVANRERWRAIRENWTKVLDDLEANNAVTMQSATDIYNAKQSAQHTLEAVSAVVSSLVSIGVGAVIGS